jgi:Gas vesicle synthesis protein GvpL/GvpF
MKLYAYCLAKDLDTLDHSPPGIAGSRVTLLRIENLAVLISETDLDAVPVTKENALAHAAVVRSILDQTTPLPFRFGTLVTEQQLSNYVSARKPALEKKLAHVRGCVEMSIKIIWETPVSKSTTNAEPLSTGTSFLTAKQREIFGGEQRAKQAAEISDWLRAEVAGLTRDEQVTVRPSERLLLSAAHLVDRVNIERYRAQLGEARNNRPELHFLFSGPWPPYSFANIELEFPMQFGVS